MPRASQALQAQRLNHARDLLQQFHHLPDAVSHMVRDTAVRLKVEENQLVGVFGEIGVLIDGLKGA